MSGRDAPSETPAARIVIVEGGEAHDVLELLTLADEVATVRSPLLFEVGERLTVRIERGTTNTEAMARVRAHSGPPDARLTELEIEIEIEGEP